jgi:hypothetical protein
MHNRDARRRRAFREARSEVIDLWQGDGRVDNTRGSWKICARQTLAARSLGLTKHSSKEPNPEPTRR